MKFSIIGTGFILSPHIEAIRDVGGEIFDVVNDAHRDDDWKDMVKNTKADCIVVLTPNDLHFEMCKFSAENKKTVLCEKPLAIDSAHVRALGEYKDIFNVLQLRHHPLVKQIRKKVVKKNRTNEIEIDVSVYRDNNYYNSWKGKGDRSGGIIFNLGIHYFDLLLYLFGPARDISVLEKGDKEMLGLVSGDNYRCKWTVSTKANKDNQHRIFKVNGTEFNFSSKDNLSFENLHKCVYQDLMRKEGVTPLQALPAIELIENLYKL